VSFATPFGICPPEYYQIVRKYYRNLRTTFDNPLQSPINRFFIGSYMVRYNLEPQDVKNRIIQSKLDNENLVVLLFHNVSNDSNNSANYEPEKFEEVMEILSQLKVKVLPLDEALNYLEK
jgi:hypothetical protein